MPDIKDKRDIKVLIDAFYEKVRKDAKIGSVFAARIKDQEWPKHLEVMYSFWNTVLFAKNDYHGNPFSKHQSLPIYQEHFDQWVALFRQSINDHFEGPKANEAMERANKMALMFMSKLEHIRANSSFKNIM